MAVYLICRVASIAAFSVDGAGRRFVTPPVGFFSFLSDPLVRSIRRWFLALCPIERQHVPRSFRFGCSHCGTRHPPSAGSHRAVPAGFAIEMSLVSPRASSSVLFKTVRCTRNPRSRRVGHGGHCTVPRASWKPSRLASHHRARQSCLG